ncbi:MAG: biotin--[acetyl-CoA-carboxylase] ligase [Pirellulales bacterium]
MMFTAEQCDKIVRETFVVEVEAHSELSSTNDRAIEKARSRSGKRPLLVIARRQQAGRGRGTHGWWSHDGALTFSLLLDRETFAGDTPCPPLIPLSMGVAVCDTILSVNPRLDVGLKWPNDVFLSGRKVAGILIERPSQPPGDVIVGIGLNVNNSIQIAPTEIVDIATSLCDETRSRHDIHAVLLGILRRIEAQLTLLKTDPDRVRQRWSDFCMLTGKRITLTTGDRQLAGICQGIAHDGSLVLQTPSGVATCVAGVVQSIE